MQTDNRAYSEAVSKAREELRGLRMQLAQIGERAKKLEAFIANAEPLIKAIHELPEPKQSELPGIVEDKEPIWKSIKLAINGKSLGFTVRDAIEALDRIGRPVKSPNKVQIVRNALMKREDTFRRVGPGVFVVVQGHEEEQEETPD